MPDVLVMQFSLGGEIVMLRLQRARFPPMFMVGKDGLREITGIDDELSSVYSDPSRGASFMVKKSADGHFLLDGNFRHQRSQMEMKPVTRKKRSAGDNNGHTVINAIPEVIEFEHNFDGQESTETQETEVAAKRRKRQATPIMHTVETAFVVDHTDYAAWQKRFPANTLNEIRMFYTQIGLTMDNIYASVKTVDPALDIRVPITVLYVVESNANNVSREPTSETLDGALYLRDFVAWILTQPNLTPSDHYMAFTAYDIDLNGGSAVGVANVGEVCTARSTSVVENSFKAIVANVAAHELGHTLSAGHDGTEDSVRCSASLQKVMSPGTNVPVTVSPRNIFEFSECSVESFRDYLARTTCTLPSETSASVALPFTGFNYELITNRDKQCQEAINDTRSSFCDPGSFPNFNEEDICTGMLCALPAQTGGQCRYVLPFEGTSCGTSRICSRGLCEDAATVTQASVSFDGPATAATTTTPDTTTTTPETTTTTPETTTTTPETTTTTPETTTTTPETTTTTPETTTTTPETTTTTPETTTTTPETTTTTPETTTTTPETTTTTPETTTTTPETTTTTPETTTATPETTTTTPETTTTTPETTTTTPETTTTTPEITTTTPETTTTTPETTTTTPETTTTTPETTTTTPETTTTTPETTTTMPETTTTTPETTTTTPETTTTTPETTTTTPETTTTTPETTTTTPETTTTTPETTTTTPETTTTTPETTTTTPETTTTTPDTTTTTPETTTTTPETTTTTPETTTTTPETTTTTPETTTTTPETTTTTPETTTTTPATTTTTPETTTTTPETTTTTPETTTTTPETTTTMPETTTTTPETTTTTPERTTTTPETTTTTPETTTTTPETTTITLETTTTTPETITTTIPDTTTTTPETTTTTTPETTTTTSETTTTPETTTTTPETTTTTPETTTTSEFTTETSTTPASTTDTTTTPLPPGCTRCNRYRYYVCYRKYIYSFYLRRPLSPCCKACLGLRRARRRRRRQRRRYHY